MYRSALILVAMSVGACSSAPKPLYEWGSYQPALLSYAKNPNETQKYADRLGEIIRKAEVRDAVPPGLYAEYGYALLSLDRTPEAVEYFAKERDKWPESVKLMDGVIGRLTKARPEPASSPATPSTGDGKPNVVEVPVPTPQATDASNNANPKMEDR